MTNKSVVSQILAINVPESLFHYTTSVGLMGIVESGKIWTTKIQYMNDNSELKLAFDYIRNEISLQRKGVGKTRTEEDLDKMCEALDSIERINVSVASFTEMGDQLSQWHGYCEIGNGYSLGFDGPKLRKLVHMQSSYNLVPCIYEEKEHIRLVKELVDNYPTKKMLDASLQSLDDSTKDLFGFTLAFSNSVLFLAPLIKSESFKEEKEWRLITPVLGYTTAKFRKGHNSLIPYWEFDVNLENTLKAVIIGPTPEPKLSSSAVQGLLLQERFINYSKGTSIFQGVKISQSKSPFRKI